MEYCLNCGLRLKGRTDKKFCNDHCRSHYNNALNRDYNAALKEINSILKRNAGILKKLSENGVTKLSRATLSAAGFDFNFFTHQAEGAKGERYNYCYGYGYILVNEEELLLTPLGNE